MINLVRIFQDTKKNTKFFLGYPLFLLILAHFSRQSEALAKAAAPLRHDGEAQGAPSPGRSASFSPGPSRCAGAAVPNAGRGQRSAGPRLSRHDGPPLPAPAPRADRGSRGSQVWQRLSPSLRSGLSLFSCRFDARAACGILGAAAGRVGRRIAIPRKAAFSSPLRIISD